MLHAHTILTHTMHTPCTPYPIPHTIQMRFCDEDVALLREAERGPLAFSVGKTNLGPLTGAPCNLGDGEARVVSKELGLRCSPK